MDGNHQVRVFLIDFFQTLGHGHGIIRVFHPHNGKLAGCLEQAFQFRRQRFIICRFGYQAGIFCPFLIIDKRQFEIRIIGCISGFLKVMAGVQQDDRFPAA